MSKKTLFTILKFGLFLGFGVFLLWLIMHNLSADEKEEIKKSFVNANYWWVGLSLVIGLFSHILRAMRWKMMLQPLGTNPRLITTFYAVMVGYLVNMAIPRMGEVTRCGIVQRYENIPFDKSIGTIIVERGIDLLCLILVTALLFVTQFDNIYNFFNEKVIQPLSASLLHNTTGLLILAAIILISTIILYIAIKRWKNSAGYTRFKNFLTNIKAGIYAIKHLESFPLFILYSVAIWVCYFLMVFVCFNALYATTHFGFDQALAVLVFGTVGIISTPGGIGAYHIIVTETLVALYGLNKADAISFSWLAWSSQTLMILILGFASLLLLSRTRSKQFSNEKA